MAFHLCFSVCCCYFARPVSLTTPTQISDTSNSRTECNGCRIWLSLAITLARCTAPRCLLNRASTIFNDWTAPKYPLNLLSPWNPNSTQGIILITCYSHNDYVRAVPLFEALAAGCASVEAHIHLSTQAESRDLPVGHDTKSLTQERTLQILYIGLLLEILENINERFTVLNDTSKDWNGIF